MADKPSAEDGEMGAANPTDQDILALLESDKVLGLVPEGERAALVPHFLLKRYEHGESIVLEGEAGDEFYLIRSGQAVVVSRDLIGQERVLATYGSGDHFGEMALTTGAPRSATVRAAELIEVYTLARQDFARLEESCPVFAAQIRQQVDLLALDSFLKKSSPFAHLPAQTIRMLAGQLQAEHVLAGAVVFREGDEGDRFYLIRSGSVEVTRGGRRLQVMEAGDCFGEVALLTAEKRTATVRALTDTELMALSKAEFNSIVQEHEALRWQFREFLKIRVGDAIARSVEAADPLTTLMPDLPAHRRKRYWQLLLGGIALFAVVSALAARTEATPLVYAALIVGSFLAPVVYVTYLHESHLLPDSVVNLGITFVLAAAVGIPLALNVEQWLGARSGNLGSAFLVAVIEESAKLLGVVWLLWRSRSRFQMDGMVYGAAAGMGFAAFENVLFGLARVDFVSELLSTLWLRTLLSPFGHGTWTAIICGAIWRQKAAARFNLRVVAAFAASVGLHTLWDWQPVQGILLAAWFLVVGGVGLVVLREMLDAANREEVQAVIALNPESAQNAGGVALRATCRVCGQVSPPGTHYCVRCGAALATA